MAFQFLTSINRVAIIATRRGRAVEQFYADIIGTIAFKFALNAGAKNIIQSTIATTQTVGAGGRPRDPKTGTLKFDLVATLRELESTHVSLLPARDIAKTHEDRDQLAHASAELFVQKFWSLRAAKAKQK
jgi:hypothetical protein